MRFKFFNINIPVLLLSFCMASVMWYVVVARDQVDVQIEVQVEYKNMPQDLVITEGLVNTINVRLRGPSALLNDIPASSRVHVVDLSSVRKGRNVIPFVYLRKNSIRALEVQDIEPSRIVLIADTVQERSVPIKANVLSSIHSAKLRIENLVVEPSSVLIRGPSATISNISNIPLTVRIDPLAQAGPHSQIEAIDIFRANVTVFPGRVKISCTVLSERKSINIERDIQIQTPDPKHYKIEPSLIEMQVEVPEDLVDNSNYLRGAQLSVAPPLLEVDESALVPLRIILPEGMNLVQSIPETITIKRLK